MQKVSTERMKAVRVVTVPAILLRDYLCSVGAYKSEQNVTIRFAAGADHRMFRAVVVLARRVLLALVVVVAAVVSVQCDR